MQLLRILSPLKKPTGVKYLEQLPLLNLWPHFHYPRNYQYASEYL